MKKYAPGIIGLFQAVGLTLYISFFAFSVSHIEKLNIEPNPLVSIITFLLAFIISASICASIGLIYAVVLFFNNQKVQAFQVILWTIGWLILFFFIFLGCNFLILV
jgi:hypothetical protein